jgi:hypothetical protein
MDSEYLHTLQWIFETLTTSASACRDLKEAIAEGGGPTRHDVEAAISALAEETGSDVAFELD